MAYAGLETLFQNMGPTYAASMAGEREGTALGLDQLTAQKEREAILAAQEANRQAQVMNPLAAQFRQGEIAAQGAQLPGLAATSRMKGTEADILDATKAGTIGKANSDNDLAIQANKLKEMANRQQMTNQVVSQILAQGPAGEAYRKQLEAQYPEIAQMLGGIPTNQLKAAQSHANEWLNQQSAAYQQALMTATKSKESHLEGARISAGAMLKGKQMDIDAGKFERARAGAVSSLQDRLLKAKNAKEKAEILEEGYAQAVASGDKELASILGQRAMEARQRALEDKPTIPDRPDLPSMGIPAAAKPTVTAPIAGNKGYTEGTTKGGIKFKVIPPGSGG